MWNFIHSYNRVGYKVNIVKQEPNISRQFERDIYNTIIRDYSMLHNNMEFANNIDVERPRKEREMDVKQIRQMLEEMMLKTSLSDAALRKLIVKELSDLQMKRKAQLAEMERIRRQKMKEIRKNQVRQGEKELTLEDVDNEKDFCDAWRSGKGRRGKQRGKNKREKTIVASKASGKGSQT